MSVCRPALPATPARALLVALALILPSALPGCGFVQDITGETARKQAAAEDAKQKSQALQQRVMRFADQYVETVALQTQPLATGIAEASKRVEVLEWRFTTATSAVQIAAGPSPVTNAVDMVVMVSLSRRIVEARWIGRYGEHARPVLASYRSLEKDAWRLLDGIGSTQQLDELRALLDAWFAENAGLSTAAFIRFDNFARAGPQSSQARASPGLLGIVGLDPMKGIDPAIREVEQTRLLAERAVYYAQRLPILLDLQANLIGARAAADPQVQQVTGAVGQVGQLSASLGRLADGAPDLIARERQAAIAQFMDELQRQQQEMLALATELRGALEAGNVTATSLNALVQSTDRLVARFKPDGGARSAAGPGRPFDINDYTRAAAELAATARELQRLVENVDGATPQLTAQVDRLADRVRGLVDYAFWRMLGLVLAVLLAAVAYRLAARRIGRTSPAAGSA